MATTDGGYGQDYECYSVWIIFRNREKSYTARICDGLLCGHSEGLTMQAVVRADGWVSWQGGRCQAALGAAGVAVHKREGDHATPAGVLRLRRVLYRADRLPPPQAPGLPREPLAPDDGWCDESGSADYNRMVRRPHAARHEALWRDDDAYDVIGVLGWNDDPVEKGRGSAIFLHVARPDYALTEGCVALALADLLALLAAGVTSLDVTS